MQEQLHFLASGGPITVGTACSGTEIIMVVLEQLVKYWSEDARVGFPNSPFSHAAVAESKVVIAGVQNAPPRRLPRPPPQRR
eukprot:9485610-Pyramimonas_sp.AAC.1